jgi:hypothetical protein
MQCAQIRKKKTFLSVRAHLGHFGKAAEHISLSKAKSKCQQQRFMAQHELFQLAHN